MDCPVVQSLEITTSARLKRSQVNGGYQYTDIVPPQVTQIPTPSYGQGQLQLPAATTDLPLGTVVAAYLTSPDPFTVKLGTRDPMVTNTFSYNGTAETLTISNPNNEDKICVQHVIVLAQSS